MANTGAVPGASGDPGDEQVCDCSTHPAYDRPRDEIPDWRATLLAGVPRLQQAQRGRTGLLELPGASATRDQVAEWERELLGVALTFHPCDEFAPYTSSRLNGDLITGDVITGYIRKVKEGTTKAGKPFLRLTLEDKSGIREVFVWDRLAKSHANYFREKSVLLAEVRVSGEENSLISLQKIL